MGKLLLFGVSEFDLGAPDWSVFNWEWEGDRPLYQFTEFISHRNNMLYSSWEPVLQSYLTLVTELYVSTEMFIVTTFRRFG